MSAQIRLMTITYTRIVKVQDVHEIISNDFDQLYEFGEKNIMWSFNFRTFILPKKRSKHCDICASYLMQCRVFTKT